MGTCSEPKIVRYLVLLCFSSGAVQADDAFDQFIAEHGRNYVRGTARYDVRHRLFQKSQAEVHAQNGDQEALWKAGINLFSDWTTDELATLRGWRGVGHSSRKEMWTGSLVSIATLPTDVSWRNLSVSTHVPNQGGCGSCWAFATKAMLEAQYQKHSGHAINVSAQELVSCVANPQQCGGAGGCAGATAELGMAYIVASGIHAEPNVPYTAQTGTCASVTSAAGTKLAMTGLTGWKNLDANKYAPLVQAVATSGPVAIAMSTSGLSSYSSGIYTGCSSDWTVNHAVTLYGYGLQGGNKYWLIRNSWGSSWGEGGFFRLQRLDDEQDHCGNDTKPSEGIGCIGGPAIVKVCGTCGVLYDSVVPLFGTALTESTAVSIEPRGETELVEPRGDFHRSVMRHEAFHGSATKDLQSMDDSHHVTS